jgi:hypothetical protein
MANFLKSKSNFKVKVRRSKERSCHKEYTMKYQYPVTYHSKVISNVKVFKKYVNLQGQGQVVKNVGINRKVLS